MRFLRGVQIEVKKAVPKNGQGNGGGAMSSGNQPPSLKLFVGGTGELTDDEFRSHFEEYGEYCFCVSQCAH